MTSFFDGTSVLEKSPTIKDDEFFKLRGFIYDKCGIYIADNRKYLLENRLLNRLKVLGLNHFGEYYEYLKYDPGARQELKALYIVITTNETSFYRNPAQLKILEDGLLQSLLDSQKQRGSRELHIWSAGCSTGEEPYTLAMIAHEVLGPQLGGWNIRISASDLSEGVLVSARKGEYAPYSLRTTPSHIKAKYFDQVKGGRYRVKDIVKQMVTFHPINLKDWAQIRSVRRSHLIFCRNVLIYFDEPMKKQVISCFYGNLYQGGYLFIGHSESLHNISRAFTPQHYPGTIVYKKGT
ncbi:CheR family methyltransferase [Desulfoplanes formicivorans]|uniref:protein-glutamate O-methyltransferase n=1 Tax=Desulfoplanes formicivorans TaxID=1592317 RepID=A0A194AL87_9BACT|nr:protein-glutamate O-methyltransferase CheR [Desulfoplanes formicivorans]GAU09801.1 chemotaxis protein [Desulfoplanes formicivorans]